MKMKMEGLFMVAIFISLAHIQLVKSQHKLGCKSTCGNIKIEYPFGTSPGCYYAEDPSFNLTCNERDELIFNDNKIINISFDTSELRILADVSYACYNNQDNTSDEIDYNITLGNLSLSKKNKYTLVGCNAVAFFTDNQNYATGCFSMCNNRPEADGECNGVGCCRTDVSVPKDINSSQFQYKAARLLNLTSEYSFNPCIYAFLVENGSFEFNALEDLRDMRSVKKFPVVLDWSIGNQPCEKVGNSSICGGENSRCSDSTTSSGYICKCKDGYGGNPYLLNSCQDIDECKTNKHNCSDPKTCVNTPGRFRCQCPSGYNSISANFVVSCKRKDIEWAKILLGITIGFLVLLLGVCCIQHKMRRKKEMKIREQFFKQNGGDMLIHRLSRAGPSSNLDVKIFTEEGMKEATNGYDESRILGQGGQGTVYKGIFADNSIVAIKKARLGGDRSQVEQFINEVHMLSQINHRNVVKLLGCCLESEVPLLVYEYITNGTLSDHLHGSSLFESSLTWEHRLRIAIEVAGTLAYLHSAASIPIIHRDIKTANILLDENLTAKVADFGASKFIPMDKEQLTTMVQGTLGYLDPEYYNTGLLNEKSDVYSFGVVLMELLSGQKALCFERPQTTKHLVGYFTSALRRNRLDEVIDEKVMNKDNQRAIQEAARIAVECTRVKGEERPRMKEVAVELERLKVTNEKHQFPDQEEIPHLLGIKVISAQGETSSSGFDSINNVARMDIEAGR